MRTAGATKVVPYERATSHAVAREEGVVYMVLSESLSPSGFVAIEEESPLSIILSELHTMVLQCRSRTALESLIDFVECYARRLFEEEEHRFDSARYSWAADHLLQHEAFFRRLRVLRVHLIVNTDVNLLADMVQESLVDWWLGHEAGADRWFAAHLRCQEQANWRSTSGSVC